jgi:hypothetical protein
MREQPISNPAESFSLRFHEGQQSEEEPLFAS